MTEISGHMDKGRKAVVYLDEDAKKYVVKCTDTFGVNYSSTFITLHAAEDFAEEWVLNK
jgi:hypothetical protein